jgi:hypothetical protein
MSNLAEVNGEIVIQYPYTFSNLQAENPYTNYGGNDNVAYWFPQTDLAIDQGYTLVQVRLLPQPTYDPSYEVCYQDTVPTLLDGEWIVGWTIVTMTPEQKAAYDAQIEDQNKQQATQLLTNTDWTAIPSVADPQQSNPYLANQNAFLSYRSQVRAIAVNPPTTPVTTWPTLPVEVWETV